MASRIDCPLCDWHTDPEPPDVGPGALAGVFGVGVMQAVALNEHMQEVERELQAHLSTHSLAEWVRKVTEQQGEIARLHRELTP